MITRPLVHSAVVAAVAHQPLPRDAFIQQHIDALVGRQLAFLILALLALLAAAASAFA